ncbi:MAG: hypothetical protein ACYC63_16940 [Armatimonadota bacterium]
MPKTNPRTQATYKSFALALASRETSRDDREALQREMAERGKWDLHFFSAVIAGTMCMTPTDEFHGRLCNFLNDHSITRKGVKCPRGHLKSTIATVNASAQDVVRDPSERILLVSATQPLSRSFLRDIKKIVQSRMFRRLYPDILPDKKLWNEDEAAILPIAGHKDLREATWKAGAVDTMLTGGHHSRIKWDDLVVPNNVETRDAAAKVIQTFKSLRPIVDDWDTPETMCYTPYKDYDLYAHLSDILPDLFTVFSEPARDQHGSSLWPEEFPKARLDALEALDTELYFAQYMLTPRPPELQIFKQADFRHFRTPSDPQLVSTEQVPAVNPNHLTRYMAIDPATGTGRDETAFAVVGVDEYMNFYLLEVRHGKMSEGDMLDLLFSMAKEYDVDRTTVEMAGPFKSLATTIPAEMTARRQDIWVEPANVGNRSKTARVRVILGPAYQQGKMFHAQRLQSGAYELQLLSFPDGRNDDIVDAVAYAVQLAREYGYQGRVTEPEIQTQKRSGLGFYPRIGYTLEQLESMTMEDEDRMYEELQEASGGIF